jgi:CxxC-x17-CxxC domain-containing protein
MEFVDRLLTCVDCGGEFVFTAGEQLFFQDKQFKNDPKRCKPCKSRRSAQASANGAPAGGPAAAGISRTETRTDCSECGISTTVPFKPTQGRPVLCRQCFKNKRPAAPEATPDATAAVPTATVDMVAPVGEHVPAAAEPAVVAQAAQA